MSDPCEGCCIFEEASTIHDDCKIRREKQSECPCLNCLIKTTCDVVCDKYEKILEELHWGKKMNLKYKKCEGCILHTKYLLANSTCPIIRGGQQDICPCLNCLIKTTCNKMCDEFRNMINFLRDQREQRSV